MATNMVMDLEEKKATVKDLTDIFMDEGIRAALDKEYPRLSKFRLARVIQVIQCDIDGITAL